MIIIGAAALIFFGPDQLPKVAKRAGQVVREVQNTSQSFIREMERAADDVERRERYSAEAAAAPAHAENESEPFRDSHVDLHAEAHDETGSESHGEHGSGLAAGSGPLEIIEPEPAPMPQAAPVAAAPKYFEI